MMNTDYDGRKMNTRFALLLTRDPKFESQVRKALPETMVLVQRCVGEALENIGGCRHYLDLVIVDFDQGCHGMTLLSAIKMLDHHLPVVCVISTDAYHAAAIAYANGAAACLAKPITTSELRVVVAELNQTKPELMPA